MEKCYVEKHDADVGAGTVSLDSLFLFSGFSETIVAECFPAHLRASLLPLPIISLCNIDHLQR
jgi:hypothetical protein